MSAVVPGSAQVTAGDAGAARVGRVVLRLWLGLLAVLAALGLLWLVARSLVLTLFGYPSVLHTVAVACFTWLAVGIGLLAHAWLLGRPQTLPLRARRWLVGLTVVLALLSGYPPLAAGRRAWAAGDLIGGVLAAGPGSAATDGRFNVLLLGGDAGPDRTGTRPDSITLASIDAATGRTVLFSLPRNLEEAPFAPGTLASAAWPKGYSCGDRCLLNGIYTWAQTHRELFPGAVDPGAEAMKQAVSGITGLTVNYYVLIDLSGFAQLIDALGGIRVTVTGRVPIGGGTSKVSGYINPGTQRLDGYHALWLARSRHGASDYERMARQRCVMDAMLQQLDPATVLERFQGIAAAGRNVVSTDLPAAQLGTFLDLALKAKTQKVRSVQFVPPQYHPAYPSYGKIRGTVARAVQSSRSGEDPAPPRPSVTSWSAGSGTAGASDTAGSGTVPVPVPVPVPATATAGTGAAVEEDAGAVEDAGVDTQAACRPAS
jgi:LCP family protein required for cell wall assembly